MNPISDDEARKYLLLLEHAIIHLRYRIRYDDAVSIAEVHDFLDSLHNIPLMLRGAGEWHVPDNINAYLKRYDDKWLAADDGASRRRGLLSLLEDIRDGKLDSEGPVA